MTLTDAIVNTTAIISIVSRVLNCLMKLRRKEGKKRVDYYKSVIKRNSYAFARENIQRGVVAWPTL